MRRFLKGLLALAALLIAAALALAANAWRQSPKQVDVPARAGVAVDAQAAASRLAQAVRLRTISTLDDTHGAEFDALHRLMETSFPTLHARLQRERFGRHALLYTWPGTDPKAQPIVLMAHQDVVPVAPGTESRWTVPPFAGELREGYVWGRGAWDDKGNLMAMLEAVEMLARAGFQPRQTVLLAFGADEELGGDDGAKLIAQALKQRGVRPAFVLDEGLLITHGIVPGVQAPVALIGVAEKGFLTVRLSAKAEAGHSSMPPPRSAIGHLSEAVTRVEQHQMPGLLRGVSRELFETVAPHMSGLNRVLLSNLWLTAPLVAAQLEKAPSTNAVLRTTAVATVFNAGDRDNLLPAAATASINFRLLPGDSTEEVLAHVRRVVDDPGITIERAPYGAEPSPVSGSDTAGYRLIARSLRELQPQVVVAPGLLMGGSDSRHFIGVADSIYRFSPVHAAAADLPRFHGTDERISIANYGEAIQFYERLLRNAAEASR
ncbi:MAG: M20 family peptidase [Aquabacterium sp.]|jgi:carboxypeptidase PM20D1|nr:MAG: M20 family peptidase [Aquabacterium sp.]TAL19034.1 MAG: M20 family peptidase [Aquabacterium sp.]